MSPETYRVTCRTCGNVWPVELHYSMGELVRRVECHRCADAFGGGPPTQAWPAKGSIRYCGLGVC